ncbi:MAG TPA: diacylglycerol kinase family protein [Solirubrobacteraceae bacterium]|jgi:YegS/Rv2252/BmrU family lipid kinase|nr:diacylglycerol kinase family protein [Solirubrobacteraceae bacterium]
MAEARKLSLIVNPSAGGGRAGRSLPGVEAALAAAGVPHRAECTRSLDHARELARAAAAGGEIAVAFGGDGLVGAVADAVRNTDGVLAVLPGGRGNDFARVLGIPLEPVAACAVLATGVERALDLGEVGGRTFVAIASCGFDSECNRIANETRFVRGTLVYVYSALRGLAGWRPARFSLGLDGEATESIVGYSVVIANSKAYGGGMYIAPDASLDDGLLDVLTIADMPKFRFLRLLPTVFKGRHVRAPEVSVRRAREVRVSADRPFTLYADGDPIAELPVTVRALPRAVRVIVPRELAP